MARRFSCTVGLVALAAIVAASPALAGGCVELSVSTSPAQTCPGSFLNVDASVTNCGETADRVILSASGAESNFGVRAARAVMVGAGATVEVKQSVPIPSRSPQGDYDVTVTATSQFGAQVSKDVTVEIVACP